MRVVWIASCVVCACLQWGCVFDACQDGDGYCDGDVRVQCGFEYSDSSAPRVWRREPCGEFGEPDFCVDAKAHTDFPMCVMDTTPVPECADNPPGFLKSDVCLGTTLVWCRGVYKTHEFEDDRRCGGAGEER
jgi:hypothetical protein